MKLRLLLISFIALLLGYTVQAQAPVALDNTMTVEQLVNNVLLGDGVTATNVKYNGQPGNTVSIQVGKFAMNNPNTPFPIDSGVVMATSNISIANLGGAVTNPEPPAFPNFTDPDLASISGFPITNAAVIEFDFTAGSDSLKFDYIFASAEYPGYTCSAYNDVFGFFLSGTDINGPYTNGAINIARIPGTDVPVGVNSVNSGSPANNSYCLDVNPNYMNDNIYFQANDPPAPTSIQIRGHTVTLPALTAIKCGETYHIKLAVGNSGGPGGTDKFLQSAVFLKAGSFAAFGDVFLSVSPQIGGDAVVNPLYDSVLVAGCSEAYIELTRPSGLTTDSILVEFGGSAILGQDYLLGENDTLFFFPEGIDTIGFTITTLWDGVPDENEYITISIFYQDGCGEWKSASTTIYFVDPYQLSSDTEGALLTCPAERVSVSAEGLGGIAPYSYDWGDYGFGEELSEVPVDVMPEDSTYYQVSISDACGFEHRLDSVLVINHIPDPLQAVVDPFTDPACPNEPLDLYTSIQDGNGEYKISWKVGKNSEFSPGNEHKWIYDINKTVLFMPEPINFTDVLPVYLMVSDTCKTVVYDTVYVNYPFFDPLKASFDPLMDHCPLDPILIKSNVENGAGDFNYGWAISNGKGKFVDGSSTTAKDIYAIPAGGVNEFTLSVTDNCGRNGTDYQYMVGEELLRSGSDMYSDTLNVIKLDNIMNVITPNGDNYNDYFAIEGIHEFDDSRLEVYDRWGKMIFASDTYPAGEMMKRGKPEGAFDGDGFGDGTYFYVINVNSGECVQSGTIEVLRGNN